MNRVEFHDGRVIAFNGDCLEVVRGLADNSVDSVVTDPPYALVSIMKRFGKTALGDGTDTSDRSRKGADGDARLAKGFMGKEWDNGSTAFAVEFWAEVLRVLKPGGHVAAFGGTRSYHRLACAIEDAGFEIRDQLAWVYGSGFPKSHDVSKAIDKHLGHERAKVRINAGRLKNPPNLVGGVDSDGDRPWRVNAIENGFHETVSDEAVSDEAVSDEAVGFKGWGTALKPAWEPICLARKPLSEKTVAANVLLWGTGSLNIDATRVGWQSEADAAAAGFANSLANGKLKQSNSIGKESRDGTNYYDPTKLNGRWPANIVLDDSQEVRDTFPQTCSPAASASLVRHPSRGVTYGDRGGQPKVNHADSGSAARFFYSAKADAQDRIGSKHPTVKPVNLMRWLVRLVTPPGGTNLDCFAGTGSTGEAVLLEGFKSILIEREKEYFADISRRMAHVYESSRVRKETITKAKGEVASDCGPLFGGSGMNDAGGGDKSTENLQETDRPDRAQAMNEISE